MKKSFYILTIIVAILIIANFVIRHYHVLYIENAIQRLVKKGEEVGFSLKYKSLDFKGYKFWDIDAVINSPSIYKGNKNQNSTYTFDTLNINSLLLENTLILRLIGDVQNEIVYNGSVKQHFVIFFDKIKPVINVKLRNSLLYTTYKVNAGESLLNYIEQLQYDVFGYKFIDITNNDQEVYSMGHIIATCSFAEKNNVRSIDVKFDFDKLRYNKEYKANIKTIQDYQNIMIGLGDMGFKGSIAIFDDIAKEKTLNDKKEPTLVIDQEKIKKLHLNSTNNIKVSISIDSLDSHTKLFSIDSSGIIALDKDQIFPYFDLSFVITNCENMIDTYTKAINIMIEGTDSRSRILSFSHIDQKQKKQLINLLYTLSSKIGNNKIKVIMDRYGNNVMRIAGIPMDKIKDMVDKIFVNDQK